MDARRTLPAATAGLASALRRGVAALVLAALLPAGAAAQVVAVVKTADDLPAFEQAIEALRKTAGGEVVTGSLAADKKMWPKVQEQLAKKSPAVWVPVGPLALEQAAAASLGAPIVFMMIPSEKNVPAGSKAAGVILRVPVDVQLKEIKKLLPAVKKVGVLYDPANTADDVAAAEKAVAGLGLAIAAVQVKDPTGLGAGLKALLDQKVDVLWMVADRTITPPGNNEAFALIGETATKAGVPVVGYAAKHTEAGALFSVGPDFADIGAQAGEIVKRVAAGAAPESIGVQPARKASLSINLKVAGTLGVALPADAQSRASQVVK